MGERERKGKGGMGQVKGVYTVKKHSAFRFPLLICSVSVEERERERKGVRSCACVMEIIAWCFDLSQLMAWY